MISPRAIALMEALRRSLLRTMPTEADLLNAIGSAKTEQEFNTAWQRWYFEGDQ